MRTSRTAARLLPAVAALVALTACGSSTSGSGDGAAPTPEQRLTLSEPASSHPPTTDATAPASSSKTRSSTTKPVPREPLLTKSVVSPGGGQTYVIKVWAQVQNSDCAVHAYGAPVIRFLQKHPCQGLSRRLATTTVNGREAGFVQNSIGFTGNGAEAMYRAAGQFRSLVTRDGTGNLNDLLREGYRLPSGPSSVPSPDAFSALSQDNIVTVVEAWYLQGSTPSNDPALVTMAEDTYLQF